MPDRLEVSRVIAASPADVFALLTDPQGHVAIDASGMLQDAEGERVAAAGDTFVVHMDREALGDLDWKLYDVTVHITTYEQDHEIAWTVVGRMKPPIGHVYGYLLEPSDDGTLVTSYCDWSDVHEQWRGKLPFPIVPESSLRATLGILDRTVRRVRPGLRSAPEVSRRAWRPSSTTLPRVVEQRSEASASRPPHRRPETDTTEASRGAWRPSSTTAPRVVEQRSEASASRPPHRRPETDTTEASRRAWRPSSTTAHHGG